MSGNVVAGPIPDGTQPLAPMFDAPPPGIPTSTVTTPADFRIAFPEFADTTKYPDATVQTLINVGSVLVRPERWMNLTAFGVGLFTAHMLAMQQMAMNSAGGASGGGVPGSNVGLVTSKSVSKVSVGRDQGSTAMEGGGPWNYTVYGQQFLWYSNLFGTGGFEVLGFGVPYQMAGVVWTWSLGVMLRWGS